jgi:hypothetical protein
MITPESIRYYMTLDNSRTGNQYILSIEKQNGKWFAFWYSSFSEGKLLKESVNTLVAMSAEEAFDSVKDLIENEDEDIIGVDWQFESPLPPWIFE